MKPYDVTWWDDLAYKLCNWALQRLASNPAAVLCRVRVALLDWMRYDGDNTKREEQHP